MRPTSCQTALPAVVVIILSYEHFKSSFAIPQNYVARRGQAAPLSLALGEGDVLVPG